MKEKSSRLGKNISKAEVTRVTKRGFWLLLEDGERFLSFKHFPWFRHASVARIAKVTRPSVEYLSWPELDVDLSIESIDRPERYPLVSWATSSSRPPGRSSRRSK